jgi:hypothetical protein
MVKIDENRLPEAREIMLDIIRQLILQPQLIYLNFKAIPK